MDNKNYKIDTKGKLAKLAEDGQKVLHVRTPTPAETPAQGEKARKKP